MERFGPTRRGGPVFRWLGEPLALDLANTVMVVREGEAVDLLAAPEDLRRWLDAQRPRLGDCAFAMGHQPEIVALREVVRRLLQACAAGERLPPDDVEHVNAVSARAPVAPQLEAGRGGRADLVQRAGTDDPLARLQGTVARSAIALLTGSERELVRVCHAPSCGMFFVGRRRWCCAACGNRARAARHYRRTRG